MKGKQGAAAARRREADAIEAAKKTKQEKAEQKAAYEAEIKRLREDLAEARSDINARAAEVAQDELRRVLAEKEAERQAKHALAERAEALAHAKDAFVFGACHYLGMTKGV
jgi:erythromycin esterase-like protein